MSCESCGHHNRAGARFCAGCGASLPRNCDTCGRDLAVDARFCDGCGASVAATPDTQVRAADAVRKTVTALFCDLVGSTAFGEKVDAESVRDARGRYHEMAKSVIEANGGTVYCSTAMV